ncbi:MAG: 4-phosphoerythronate dehydrogenase [Mariprofundaceae bacterium]|nr:4-phosphoerythronate dehydrogenase [Mariprofundaceae bacterium]
MTASLHIVADRHIWGVESAFSTLPGFGVTLRVLEHGDICREALQDAEILLTRSSTRANANLLEGTPVRFAATATIGDDHFDKNWLTNHGIAFANAAGSSTGSVIEYMVTVLLDLHARNLITLPGTTIGIIGAGRIGGALAKVCKALGIRTLINDPPRARAEGDTGFCSLNELLEQADVLTLHTPLIHDGEDCTVHLLNAARLSDFRGKGIINAGRGTCVDNTALVDWLDDDAGRFAVLDCWENEPAPLHRLLMHPQLVIGTPHIAGHSLDGKAANTQYAYNALCRWLKIVPEWNMQDHLPPPGTPVEITCTDNPWHDLHTAATRLYPIGADYEAMHTWGYLPDSALPEAFTAWRRHYPVRRAWEHIPVHFIKASPVYVDQTLRQLAQALGMNIV